MSTKQTKRYCRIPLCENNLGSTREDLRLFKMPQISSESRMKWDAAIMNLFGIEFKTSQPYICSDHFHANDLYQKKDGGVTLKPNAIPTTLGKIIKQEPCVDDVVDAINFVDIGAIKTEPADDAIIQHQPQPQPRLQPQSQPQPQIQIQPQPQLQPLQHHNRRKRQCEIYIKVESNEPAECLRCVEHVTMIETLNGKCKTLMEENKLLKSQIKSLLKKAEKPEKLPKTKQRCQICRNQSEDLKQHMCTNETEIQCEYCASIFKSTIDLGEHFNEVNHKNVRYYRCNKCNMAFLTEYFLKCHQESKQTHRNLDIMEIDVPLTNKIYKCAFCDESFAHSRELVNHLKTNHKESKVERYECYLCKAKQISSSDAKQHFKLHSRDEKCEICDENLTFSEIKKHVCCSEEKIKCEYCESWFDATVKCVKHVESAHNDRTMYQCHKCPRYFGMFRLREFHERQHKDIVRSFVCEICPKTFATQINLNSHVKRHKLEKTHLCSECGKCFPTEYNLNKHISVVHEKDSRKAYTCNECGKVFFNYQLYTDHRDLHLNLTYKCNKCTSTYSTKRSLFWHTKRKHSDFVPKKRFSCNYCPMKFEKRDRLAIHIRKHTGEKPFVCEYCPDKKYAYKQDLVKHLNSHLKNEFYKCDMCDKGFRRLLELRRHMFIHYKEQMATGEGESSSTNVN